jgi:hypothetical protein
MAEWLRRKFRGKRDVYDPSAEVYAQSILNSQGPDSASHEAIMKDLEINIHTILDEGITDQLDELQVTPEQQYKIKIPNGDGGLVERTIFVPKRPVPWALALRVAVSKLGATRFISKRDATIYKNRQRNEFLKIKRSMSYEERRLFSSYVNQIEFQCLEAIDDSIEGQKMLALKTSGRHLRVGVQTGKEGGAK